EAVVVGAAGVAGVVALALTSVAACGSSSAASLGNPDASGGEDGGSESESGTDSGPAPFPAPHPAMPQAMKGTGPVQTAPKLVEIPFQGETLQDDIDKFMNQLVADTAYWGGATAEYGVGPLSAAAPVHLAESAAAKLTDSEVHDFLTSKISAGG